MQEMYNAKLGSPITTLAEDISSSQTTITVVDASFLGAAPNIATITTGVNSETVKYTGITLNTLTGVTRGFQGSAQAWSSGTNIARIITAYDHDAFLANINEVDGDLATHKAETVSDYKTFTRDLTLTGEQILAGFAFVPEILIIQGVVNNSNKSTHGMVVRDVGQNAIGSRLDNGGYLKISSAAIGFWDGANTRTAATATINADKSVTFNWTHGSTGATGTADIYITAIAHKEV